MAKIMNPKVEVPTGVEYNDKDIANSLLSHLKTMEKNYALAMTEASNECLYQNYKNIFDKLADMQREVFEYTFRNGWYVLDEAEGEKVGEKFNTLKQELADLDAE